MFHSILDNNLHNWYIEFYEKNRNVIDSILGNKLQK